MYVFKYVMIYMGYCCVSDFYNFMYCNVMCICEPPSIPNFQILLLSIVSKFTVMRQQNLIVIPLKIDIQCHETACMGAKCQFK